MNLTRTQAEQLIKEPKNAREINRARQKRIRHRLHTEPDTDTLILGDHHIKFLSWVKSILKSDENYERFKELYRPPIFTNELTESIFSEYEKVFEARNNYEKLNFENPELENDALEYRKRLGDYQFWETQGFETFKTSIDNLVVIDLPKIDPENPSQSSRPEPYYYILDIDNLIDVENSRVKGVDQETGEILYFFKTEYVIFRGEADLVYVFDDTHFRTYKYKYRDNKVEFIAETPHDLGYTPARSFWTTPLNSKCTFQKRSPITNSLSEMDWLLFFSIARKYLELYAPFPLYAIYKGACTYKTEGKAKGKCVDGYIKYEGYELSADINSRERCPKCSNKLKVGPGNIIELRVPKDKEDPDLMANPMKVIPAERDSLDYMREALREKYDEIFHNCVGRGQDAKTDQAQNELQIRASFESRSAVLLKIKRNFEIIHSFALDTCLRLRYGAAYKGLVINYGDEFFVKDEETQTKELTSAKQNGAPSYELETRRREIWESRYRNNPEMVERLTTLRHLEPYPDHDLAGLMEIRNKVPGAVSLEDIVIKLNFGSFIDRFEREQTNVMQFAKALTYDKKIELIRAELDKYAAEYITKAKASAPDPDPAPAPAA